MFCRQWLAQLEQHKAELTAAGVTLTAVGLGEPKHAQRYCGQLAPSVMCLVNATKEAYKAFGLARGSLMQLMGPQIFINGAKASAQGFAQGETTGDALMIGGTFVIDQAGIIRFAHYDADASDHPEFSEILRAVKALQLT
jgi:peroxiredoxin